MKFTVKSDEEKEAWKKWWDGMLPCCCGCGQWGRGTVPEGVYEWYLPGHKPKDKPIKDILKTYESPHRKVNNLWWCRGMGWFWRPAVLVFLIAWVFGAIIEVVIK